MNKQWNSPTNHDNISIDMEEITFLIINSIFFFFPSLGMNRMSDPLLQDYYDRVAECLLQRAFSLGQFEVNPPEEIFMTVS